MAENDLNFYKEEWHHARSQMQGIGLVALALLTFGATFFHFAQKLSWIDAFYFCTVTLTTVGYGDIVPKTDAQKLFIMGYVLVGIGTVATFASLLIKSSSLRRRYNLEVRKEKSRLKQLNSK